MSQLGADPDQLEGLAKTLELAANQIDGSSRRVGSAVRSTRWAGADAHGFVSAWSGSFSPLLVRCAVMLREQSQLLRSQAQEQRTASSAAGISGPAGSPSTSSSLDPNALVCVGEARPVLVSSTIVSAKSSVDLAVSGSAGHSVRVDTYSDGSRVIVDLGTVGVGGGVGVG